jgi:crooked neck
VPPPEKRFWRRYIYLWINYAVFEEMEAQDIDHTRQVYKECIKVIPHKQFSFSKIWIMYANFEVRQKNLDAARIVFGHAIGMANVKLFNCV